MTAQAFTPVWWVVLGIAVGVVVTVLGMVIYAAESRIRQLESRRPRSP